MDGGKNNIYTHTEIQKKHRNTETHTRRIWVCVMAIIARNALPPRHANNWMRCAARPLLLLLILFGVEREESAGARARLRVDKYVMYRVCVCRFTSRFCVAVSFTGGGVGGGSVVEFRCVVHALWPVEPCAIHLSVHENL